MAWDSLSVSRTQREPQPHPSACRLSRPCTPKAALVLPERSLPTRVDEGGHQAGPRAWVSVFLPSRPRLGIQEVTKRLGRCRF